MRLFLLLFCSLACCGPAFLPAQQRTAVSGAETASAAPLPDAPAPVGSQESKSSAGPPPASSARGVATEEVNRENAAQQQIREQKGQRILGIFPAFNISYRDDAVPLTAKEKMNLAFSSAIDPVTFAGALLVAGWGEVINASGDRGFGWGPRGYARRSGAKYADSFDGTMIGNGILPSLLHQDPRYFRRGYGSFTRRTLYAMSASFICKHDGTRRWEPNYSNVGGNLASGAISNLYYPDSGKSGWGTTFENGMVVTAEGSLGAVFQEFWPDISRKFLHKDPTRGLDKQLAAEQRTKHSEKVTGQQ